MGPSELAKERLGGKREKKIVKIYKDWKEQPHSKRRRGKKKKKECEKWKKHLNQE